VTGAGRPAPGRNITLACGHPEGLATLHRPGYEDDQEPLTAWCPVCEADVDVSKTDT
jgi:hypothetical protein